MRSLINYLGSFGGNIYLSRAEVNYKVTGFNEINDKIIPFFKKYPIRGVKALNFSSFCQIAKLMKAK